MEPRGTDSALCGLPPPGDPIEGSGAAPGLGTVLDRADRSALRDTVPDRRCDASPPLVRDLRTGARSIVRLCSRSFLVAGCGVLRTGAAPPRPSAIRLCHCLDYRAQLPVHA